MHGAGLTHLDALCHYSWNQKLCNGFPLEGVTADNGCAKDGLDNLKEGIVTRGVLVDMTRLKTATPRDPASTRVYPEDIEAWEKQTGLTVSAGDALFAYNPAPPAPAGAARGPAGGGRGFDLSVVPWMKTRGVAVTSGVSAIADDIHADHRLTLVALGTYLIDGVRSDPAGGDSGPAEPVGVPARRLAGPGARQHGLPRQPARDVLKPVLSTFRG